MNLTEELHNIERAYGNRPDVGSDPLWHGQLAIWFEMAKRIEALEQQIVEANRHCEAMHTIGRGPQRAVDNDQDIL